MNSDRRQEIELFLTDGKSQLDAGDWGPAIISFNKALEGFARQDEDEPEDILTADDQSLKKEIEGHLQNARSHLARRHFEWGTAAFQNKEFQRAVEELEEASDLASEDQVAFLEEIKKILDQARVKNRERQMYTDVTPFVERGDDFRHSGNHGEAILEYQEAAKLVQGLPANHRFVEYVQQAIMECRRQLIKPYLGRIHRASLAGKVKQAHSLVKRALFLLDDKDQIYRAFLEQLRLDLAAKLTVKEAEEGDEDESPDLWTKAVKDYEEALDLYSSFTLTDPLSPAYSGSNVYEDKFLTSRRNLAQLYKSRGDRFRDRAQLDKAIKNYKEALKLFPRSDRVFHETFRELKKLRAQMTQPASQES